MDTQHFTSLEGLYVLKLVSKETDTYVHVYMSTELGGPQALQTSKFMQIKLIKRPKKRVTVKWETRYYFKINIRSRVCFLCAHINSVT